MNCYVYIIRAGNFVKIGVAENVEKRLSQMQTGSPHELRVLARLPFQSRKAAYGYEKELHFRLKKYHHHGEWFQERCIREAFRASLVGVSAKTKKRLKGLRVRDSRWERQPGEISEAHLAEMELVREAMARI